MFISRRKILVSASSLAAGGVLGGASLAARAQAPVNIKIGTNVQNNHSIFIRLTEAADAIRKETDGRVNVRIFPNGQLGSDTDMLSQVRSGGLEFFTVPGVVLAAKKVRSLKGLTVGLDKLLD